MSRETYKQPLLVRAQWTWRPKASLYYKTEPFLKNKNVDQYIHPNNWEILHSVNIFNELGFDTEIIDRDIHRVEWVFFDDKRKEEGTELFVGLGVGDSARNFLPLVEVLQPKKTVLLALSMDPNESRQRTIDRHDMFKRRTGVTPKYRRVNNEIYGEAFQKIIDKTDAILTCTQKGSPAYESLLKFNKPVESFVMSTSPKVKFQESWFETRKKNLFLYFAGNGLICKGVDLAIETFLKPENKDKTLVICGPYEEDVIGFYYDRIVESGNIAFSNFVDVGSEDFNNIVSQCSFCLMSASREGLATAITTCMTAGLVPIINKYTGVCLPSDFDDLALVDGAKDSKEIIDDMSEKIHFATQIKEKEYRELVNKTLEESKKYTQENFSKTYKKAIENILKMA